jgi:hypothetical protein
MNAHIHPTMQAALAPFAPRHRTPTIELNYGDVPMLIEYDYCPAERPIYDVESPLCGPGCEASVEVIGVYIEGHEVLEMLGAGMIKHITELVLEKLGD